jgi:hypothetical protein
MGEALNVNMQANDENGLRSNVVDFNVARLAQREAHRGAREHRD